MRCASDARRRSARRGDTSGAGGSRAPTPSTSVCRPASGVTPPWASPSRTPGSRRRRRGCGTPRSRCARPAPTGSSWHSAPPTPMRTSGGGSCRARACRRPSSTGCACTRRARGCRSRPARWRWKAAPTAGWVSAWRSISGARAARSASTGGSRAWAQTVAASRRGCTSPANAGPSWSVPCTSCAWRWRASTTIAPSWRWCGRCAASPRTNPSPPCCSRSRTSSSAPRASRSCVG